MLGAAKAFNYDKLLELSYKNHVVVGDQVYPTGPILKFDNDQTENTLIIIIVCS